MQTFTYKIVLFIFLYGIRAFRLKSLNMSIIPTARVTTTPRFSIKSILSTYTFPFQLSFNNHMIWKSKILLAIAGGNLEDSVTNNIVELPQLISSLTTSYCEVVMIILNPTYALWIHIDPTLLSWIQFCISSELQTQLMDAQISVYLKHFQKIIRYSRK